MAAPGTSESPSPAAVPCPPVFLSHSSVDAVAARQIASTLEAAGIPCWIAPRDISAGAEYNAAIMDGLNRCRALLLVHSRHAAASDPVLREVERATHRKLPVIPVRIENAPVSQGLEYLIASRQWIDACVPPLERHLREILAEVQRSLGLQVEKPPAPAGEVPEFIGPYRILDVLGEGGMGSVYRAEQRSPIRRVVAVKLIKAGFDTKEVIARFESERQALARMDHPHVAKVLDAGADTRGRPFFVMEYIPGRPITQFADEQRLTIALRLELFVQVCEAVAHAHTKGIIHRDLKAANVLAYLADGQPMAKVIDFGVAKALTGDRLSDRTLATACGQVVGTYDSMSPEQAAGSADIDTRSDVYSLGALLYELLTGAKPFDDTTLAQAADEEKRRIIREVDPPKPSTRISTLGKQNAAVAAARQARLDTLTKALKSELEWIPLKALRKERDRRYASPLALADDVRNYLAGRPLVAAPESRWYRLRKWAYRNRAALATAAAFLVLLAAAVGTYIHGIRAEQARTATARDEALRQKDAADAAQRQAEQSAATAHQQARLSLQVIQSVIFDIQGGLQNVPGTLEIRRKILKTAIDGLNQVVRFSEGAQVDRNMAVALSETGNVLMRLGLLDKDAIPTARQFFQQAYAMDCKLVEHNPQSAQAQRDLAISLERLGDLEQLLGHTADARKYQQQSLEIRQRLAAADPHDARAQRDLAIACDRLGTLARQQGLSKEALQEYQDALTLRKRLAETHPADAQALREVSISYDNLGNLSLQLGHNADAEKYFQDALAIRKRLAEANPNDPQAQRDVSVGLNLLGDFRVQLRQFADAQQYYQDGLAIALKLAQADLHDSRLQRDLAISYDRVGDMALKAGRSVEALKYFQDSLTIRRKLAEGSPGLAQAQSDLAIAYRMLGNAQLQLGLTRDAQKYYQDCLAIDLRLAEADPNDGVAQRYLSMAYGKLGAVAVQMGQYAEALQHYQAALALAQQLAAKNPLDAGIQGDRNSLALQIAYCNDALLATAGLEQIHSSDAASRPRLLYVRCAELARRGDAKATATAAGELRALAGKDARDLYHAACGYSLCVRILDTPPVGGTFVPGTRPRTLAPDLQAQRQKYLDLALATLQDAIAAGYQDADHLRSDDDLLPLRALPAFQKLLASIPAAGSGK